MTASKVTGGHHPEITLDLNLERTIDGRAVEQLLISDWASGFRITTVPQAMVRLGIADDPEARWGLANRMDALWHSTLETPQKMWEINSAIGRMTDEECAALSQRWRDQVGSWDRASIMLTDNEKLMARQILWREKCGSNLLSPDDIGTTLGIGSQETANGIRMLTRLGFLDLPEGQPVGEYILSEDHDRFLDGLGFRFIP